MGLRAANRQKTFIVTPYSEFFYYAAKDYRFRNIVNGADFALPDGTALQWLADYYTKPITVSNYYLKIIQAAWQELTSGFSILFSAKRRNAIIPERTSGADFFWDIMAEADARKQKVFLLGGFGNTAGLAKKKVLMKYPDLKIETSNANPNELAAIDHINAFAPEYLLVAYGPIKQEYWISEHLAALQVAVAIGVGGTLDYVAGTKRRAPKFVREIGMEWLHRLVTQPYRFKRIWHATASLGLGAVRDKVFNTLGYRQNAASVIINSKKEVLILRRCRERTTTSKDIHWQFPQGGIEKGETAEQGALREMKEELGTEKFTVLGMCTETYSYEWQHFFRELFRGKWRYKGQTQYIFYLYFTGNDSELVLDNSEIDSFCWVKPEELYSYIHPMRHAMLAIALSELPENLAKIS